MVDYSSLENCRAERHRGFESLSLRKAGTSYCFSIRCSGFFCALAVAFGGRLEVGMSLVRNSGWCASIHTGERLKSAVLADFSKRLAENSASTAENGGGGAEVSIICPNCCLGRFFFFLCKLE